MGGPWARFRGFAGNGRCAGSVRPPGCIQPDPKEVATFRRTLVPRDHPVFAGAYDRETADFRGMGLAERTLVRRHMPSGDWRAWPAIQAWAHEIVRDLVPPTA